MDIKLTFDRDYYFLAEIPELFSISIHDLKYLILEKKIEPCIKLSNKEFIQQHCYIHDATYYEEDQSPRVDVVYEERITLGGYLFLDFRDIEIILRTKTVNVISIPPEKNNVAIDLNFDADFLNSSGGQDFIVKISDLIILKDEIERFMAGENIQKRELEASQLKYKNCNVGRPSYKEYYLAEFQKRIKNNNIEPTLSAQCKTLVGWLTDNIKKIQTKIQEETQAEITGFPPIPKAKSLEDWLRGDYNEYQKKHVNNI